MDTLEGGILAHDVLANMASKMDDATLARLYAVPAYHSRLAELFRSNDFWYQRTINLTNRDLVWNPNTDWKHVYYIIRDTTLERRSETDFSLAFQNVDALRILEAMYGPLEIKSHHARHTVFTSWLIGVSDPRVFDYLIQKFSDLTYPLWSVFRMQVRAGHREIVARLLSLTKTYKSVIGRFQALRAVVQSGDVETARFLLEDVAIPVDQDDKLWLLLDAIDSDNLEMYLYMRERYPELSDDQGVLSRAAVRDKINVFRYVFERSPRAGLLYLTFNGESGVSRVFSYLLPQVERPDWMELLQRAVDTGSLGIVEMILPRVDPSTDLTLVPWSGRHRDTSPQITALLLERFDPVPRIKEIVDKIGEKKARWYIPALSLLRDPRVKVQELPREVIRPLFVMLSDEADGNNTIYRSATGSLADRSMGEIYAADSDSIVGNDTYSLVLRELMFKRPSKTELLDWMASLDDPDLEQAAADVTEAVEWVPERLIPFNCLMLAMLYPTLTRREQVDQLTSAGLPGATLAETVALLFRYELANLENKEV